MERILKWMYNATSEVIVTVLNFLQLIEVSVEWKLHYIENRCLDFIKNNEDVWKSYNYHILDFVLTINQRIIAFIVHNFCELPEEFMKDLYKKLTEENVSDIISHDNLACSSEDKVYDFIIGWVKWSEEDRKQYLWKLIKYVRLPFVSGNSFSKIICEPLLKEFTIEINNRAHKHTLLASQQSENSNFYQEYKDNKDFKRRIPISLGKPSVIFALRNQTETDPVTSPVEYLKVPIPSDCERNTMLRWKPLMTDSLAVFRPPRELSKVVAFQNGILYAIGGLTTQGVPTSQVDMLDLSFFWKKWFPANPLNMARINFGVCNDDRYIYVAGGTSHDENILNSVEVYDTVSGNWKLMKEVDTYYSQFKGPSAVCHNKSVYVVGNSSDHIQRINVVHELDYEDYEYICFDKILCNACAVILNNSLFVIGGRIIDDDGDPEYEISNEVYEFNLVENKHYSCSKYLKNEREKASAVAIDDNLYVFGGLNSKKEPIFETEIIELNGTYIGGTVSRMSAKYIDQNVIVLTEKLLEYTKIQLNDDS